MFVPLKTPVVVVLLQTVSSRRRRPDCSVIQWKPEILRLSGPDGECPKAGRETWSLAKYHSLFKSPVAQTWRDTLTVWHSDTETHCRLLSTSTLFCWQIILRITPFKPFTSNVRALTTKIALQMKERNATDNRIKSLKVKYLNSFRFSFVEPVLFPDLWEVTVAASSWSVWMALNRCRVKGSMWLFTAAVNATHRGCFAAACWADWITRLLQTNS